MIHLFAYFFSCISLFLSFFLFCCGGRLGFELRASCLQRRLRLPLKTHLQSTFTWLFWRWSLINFCLDWPSNWVFWISASQVASIVGVSQGGQLSCNFWNISHIIIVVLLRILYIVYVIHSSELLSTLFILLGLSSLPT
jgi:hypothetical protein